MTRLFLNILLFSLPCFVFAYEPNYKVCSIFLTPLPYNFENKSYQPVNSTLVVDEMLKTYIESLQYTLNDKAFKWLPERSFVENKLLATLTRTQEISSSIECFLNEYQKGGETSYYQIEMEGIREEGFLLIRDEKIVARLVEYVDTISAFNDGNKPYKHDWGFPNK